MNNFVKSQTGCDYRELIEGINATPIRLCDQKSVDINEKRYFGIRHDVDDDWPTSQKMAEFEASLGLKTTYYLLDSRRYFDYSPAFLKEVKAINNLGHEIGIHNDALIRWKMAGDKGDIREMLDKPLRYLRSAGIEVVGTAAHGDQICRDMGFLTFEIWEENSRTQKNPKLVFPRYSLKEFGLEYEAYFLKRTAYMSDNHGGWTGGVTWNIKPHEVLGKGINQRKEILDGFHSLDHGMLQILIHPQHWMAR